ncbi:MAG: hypothetical protein K6E51_04705 [Treponema sp.]|nr:hypothetical protein [Treponema sp.]
MNWYQKVFAVIFLILLIGFGGANVFFKYQIIIDEIESQEITDLKNSQNYKTITHTLDNILANNLLGKYGWNELFGLVCRAIGKNEENNFTYVRDKHDFLYAGNFWNTSQIEASELALRVRRLMDQTKPEGTQVIVLMYPTKYNEAWSHGYYGIPYNDMNYFADEVLIYFRRYNVNYIDFREVFINQGMTMDDIFYRTDHHWTIPTAFFATGVIIDHLNKTCNANLDPTGKYRDINNYTTETYEQIYMGSQGRETGVSYAGLDDYTYIYPKFPTSFKYTAHFRNGKKEESSGSILDTLISRKYPDYSNVYARELNNSYLHGVCLRDDINNELQQGGTNVLFIRDSYSSPVATFMAPMFNRTDLVWALYFTPKDIDKVLKSEHYDYIFVALAIDNFTNEGFPFGIKKATEEEQK